MPRALTITDLEFTEARLYREDKPDGTFDIKVSVGYKLIANGERFTRDKTLTLTGARRTSVITFFNNLKADLLTEEGI